MNSRPHDWSGNAVAVDIRLCGSIPRHEIRERFQGAPCTLQPLTSLTRSSLSNARLAVGNESDNDCPTHNCDKLQGLMLSDTSCKMNSSSCSQPPCLPAACSLECPAWAVPAKGETRLEPVCESIGRQCAVDLTKQASFMIGRSPNSDIQLFHATSSRRHAMLFHHSNGACYIVDCGSAHGTFVNGVRVPSPARTGVVVPHKVRRGALVRFGGLGAPSFVLKSFNFQLRDIESCRYSSDMGDLIKRNTRLNALGRMGGKLVGGRVLACIDTTVNRKRSFDSLDSRSTVDDNDSCCFKRRCLSPPMSEYPILPMVSPDLPTAKQNRVSFSADPPQIFHPALVTPDDSGDEY